MFSFSAQHEMWFIQTINILICFQICEDQQVNHWKKVIDPDMHEPYAITGDMWCGYDDEDSLRKKVSFLEF